MAKVSYSKLGLKLNVNENNFNCNDEDIAVKAYLPINEKLNLIADAINQMQAEDENNFINYGKLDMYFKLAVIFNYTNISFTEKQKEDLIKLYDIMESNHLIDMVINHIPQAEYETLLSYLNKTVENIYQQRNSALGILEAISKDYSNLDLDATEIQKKLGDPNNMALLKDVLNKLG